MAVLPVNQMIDKPNLLASAQQGYAFGTQMRQQREEGERRNKLAGIAQQAYTAPVSEQSALVGQAVGVDPAQGFQLADSLSRSQLNASKAEDDRAQKLRGAAKYMLQAIESKNPAQIQGAHRTVAQFMSGFGQQFPEQFDEATMLPKIQEVLAQTAYLDEGGGDDLKSLRVGADGYYYAIKGGQLVNTQVKADPNVQIVNGNGGFYRVDRRASSATPVVLGGAPGQQQFEDGTQAPAASMTGRDGMPVALDPSLSPQDRAAIMAQEGGQAPRGFTAQEQALPESGQAQQLQAPVKEQNPLELRRLQLAEQAAARAEESAGRQRFGNAPAGFRFKDDGTLEAIPGGPKPAGSAATEGERKAATLLKRLDFSLGQLNAAVDEDPSAASPNVSAEVLRRFPLVGEAAANAVTPAERQRVDSAQLDILDAALTLGTGAAYTREQLEGYRKAYFPQIGDSDAAVKDKAARLRNVIEAAKIAAGRAAPAAENAPASSAPRRLKFNPATGRLE